MPWPATVTLRGEHVVLEPLAHAHARGLREAVADGALHELWYTSIPAPEDMEAEIDRRLALRAQGSMLPFASVDARSGQPVGMTTFMRIDAPNRRLEIGSTWLRRSAQRTPINTEAKWLMLRHAFEALDCIAVEFQTHAMNWQSRAAIERLGAKLDGVLRSHAVLANGTIRDSAVYSVTAAEWPAVAANLRARLDRDA